MKQIFINLPVQDVEKSMHFYSQLGFVNYPVFTFDDQKCMAWGEQILVMLQSNAFFTAGSKKPVYPGNYLTPSFTLPVASIEKVHELVERGLKAGGKEPTPIVDEGFMQVRYIKDLDGYNWGIIYLDLAKFKKLKRK